MNDQLKADLQKFCSLDCDRYDFLIRWLTKEEISHSVIPTENSRHIMIRLDKVRPYLKRYYVKTIVAHYDRVSGTPGANDNSAAVFQLLSVISRLKKLKFAHNIQIILTDSEELLPGKSVTEQGAFKLARLFREKKINNCIFFVLDMCGIGDTIVTGRAGLKLLQSMTLQDNKYGRMLKRTEDFNNLLSQLFLSFRDGEYFNLNTLFSDDLGFLLNGYPSIQLSVLPYGEAMATKIKLQSVSQEDWDALMEKGMLSQEYRDFIKPILPGSWQKNHSELDSIETLDYTAFELIDQFIMELATQQYPIGEIEA